MSKSTLREVQPNAKEGEHAALAQRVQELEDQVQDVMYFLEARTKIEEGTDGGSGWWGYCCNSDPRAVDAAA